MKYIAFIPGLLFLLVALNSCCSGPLSGKRVTTSASRDCGKCAYPVQVTEWVEEEVYVDTGAKGGKAGTMMVRRPVVKTVCKRIKCGDCGSWYQPNDACCGTVGTEVLRRVTAQGGTGEPHIGQIATMKVLAP